MNMEVFQVEVPVLDIEVLQDTQLFRDSELTASYPGLAAVSFHRVFLCFRSAHAGVADYVFALHAGCRHISSLACFLLKGITFGPGPAVVPLSLL